MTQLSANPPLIGREAELAALTTILTEALGGTLKVALVEGTPEHRMLLRTHDPEDHDLVLAAVDKGTAASGEPALADAGAGAEAPAQTDLGSWAKVEGID